MRAGLLAVSPAFRPRTFRKPIPVVRIHHEDDAVHAIEVLPPKWSNLGGGGVRAIAEPACKQAPLAATAKRPHRWLSAYVPNRERVPAALDLLSIKPCHRPM